MLDALAEILIAVSWKACIIFPQLNLILEERLKFIFFFPLTLIFREMLRRMLSGFGELCRWSAR